MKIGVGQIIFMRSGARQRMNCCWRMLQNVQYGRATARDRPYYTRVHRLARPVYSRGGACPRPASLPSPCKLAPALQACPRPGSFPPVLHHMLLYGIAGSGAARGNLDLTVNGGEMPTDGTGAEHQLFCYLGIGKSLCHQAQYLDLSCRQAAGIGG